MKGEAFEKMLWQQRNRSHTVLGRQRRPGREAGGRTVARRTCCHKMDKTKGTNGKQLFGKASFSVQMLVNVTKACGVGRGEEVEEGGKEASPDIKGSKKIPLGSFLQQSEKI